MDAEAIEALRRNDDPTLTEVEVYMSFYSYHAVDLSQLESAFIANTSLK